MNYQGPTDVYLEIVRKKLQISQTTVDIRDLGL